MRNIFIQTDRLYIVPQHKEELQKMCRQEVDQDMRQAYQEMIETMQQLPGQEEWGTNWQIALLSGQIIGGLGFNGAPDENGRIEIGYGIGEAYRFKGYATEAVKSVVKWVLQQDNVQCVVAQTAINNHISQKVLLNCGFVRNGYGDKGVLYEKYL